MTRADILENIETLINNKWNTNIRLQESSTLKDLAHLSGADEFEIVASVEEFFEVNLNDLKKTKKGEIENLINTIVKKHPITRNFTLEDQEAFALISGDYNPMHVNELEARRMIYGAPVVHGIHLLVWALSETLPSKMIHVEHLKVSFRAPLRINRPVLINIINSNELHLLENDKTIAVVQYRFRIGKRSNTCIPEKGNHAKICMKWNKSTIDKASGSFDLVLPTSRIDSMFPDLRKRINSEQIAFLIATSKLVGMDCPGLHSVFSGLEVDFSKNSIGDNPDLHWKVVSFDPRFSMVKIEVASQIAAGSVTAFLRPSPVKQASFSSIKNIPDIPDYTGKKCLVVGGSRGLGELTSKILAAAGADVLLSYKKGKGDAEIIMNEIASGGGRVDIISLDVINESKVFSERLPESWRPSHIFYFATPPIFIANKGKFDYKIFEKFNHYYIRSFSELINELRPNKGESLKVFYPSTVAINEPPPNMGEYSASKSAGEGYCKFVEKVMAGLKIYIERLPRLSTDQTASFIPVKSVDSTQVILNVLRSME